MSRQFRRNEYTVGWICALPVELAAAQEILDEEHEDLDREDYDENVYSLGSIGGHNVVIVCLPVGRIGNNPAASVAVQMRATFRNLQFGLMVGIGGGVPRADADIRLGDVVVSQPNQTLSGVVQYDAGKATRTGFERTGSLNSPPQVLLSAVAKVRSMELRGRSKLLDHLQKITQIPRFQRSKAGPDVLYEASYDHAGGYTCDECNPKKRVSREPRDEEEEVLVHYGTIASGNQVIKNGSTRDTLSKDLGGVLCFEMEAAGLQNSFPCLVVRGICDYCDDHKNKKWQPFAAATAAAYAKEVLLMIPPALVVDQMMAMEKPLEIDITTLAIKELTGPTYVIPPRNSRFVGRTTELETLKDKLIGSQDCRKITVVGLGGTGKTQIVLQFAYFMKEAQCDLSIFWMPALSMEGFEQTCTEIVRQLRIPHEGGENAKELVQTYLSTPEAGRWLIILDNADDADIVFGSTETNGILDYMPTGEHGMTVFTTRNMQVATSLTGADVLELDAMNRVDATNFLRKCLIKKESLHESTINELLDELACLPLAIAQAAAYLNMNRTSIGTYLRLLRNTEQDIVGLMSKEFRDDTRYKGTPNAVATTWVVSFTQIRERDEVSANLLSFMSCIEWKAIPRSILPSITSQESMESAIGLLHAYSFISRRDSDDEESNSQNEEIKYDMHRLVHLATRIWISQQGDVVLVWVRALDHLSSIFPDTEYANHARWRAYLPHAFRLLGDRQVPISGPFAFLCHQVGACLRIDGRTLEAIRWVKECSEWRKVLDVDHPQRNQNRLISEYGLARAYLCGGQVKRGIDLLCYVVSIQEQVLVESHQSILSSKSLLAQTYIRDRQIDRAIALLEDMVDIMQRHYDAKHRSRLLVEHHLAYAYLEGGQIKPAAELFERILSVLEEMEGKDQEFGLSVQHDLARAYFYDHQVDKAIQIEEYIVDIRNETLSEDDPHRCASEEWLEFMYSCQDNQSRDRNVEEEKESWAAW
ncbi:kinesin light chain [Pyrenochaeta sp. DS3sAY3a]|nr:kinesin light chain [Pyrenochaeta sp. DS3sAY3a]